MTDDPAYRVAKELRRRGLAAPARLLADAHRPLGPLLSDVGVAIGPLLGALGGDALARLLADGAALDELVDRLDEGSVRDAEPD
jgi:hypothetical protein